jgi:hypothetical protein
VFLTIAPFAVAVLWYFEIISSTHGVSSELVGNVSLAWPHLLGRIRELNSQTDIMSAHCSACFHDRGGVEMVRSNAVYNEFGSRCHLIEVLLFHCHNDYA